MLFKLKYSQMKSRIKNPKLRAFVEGFKKTSVPVTVIDFLKDNDADFTIEFKSKIEKLAKDSEAVIKIVTG